ncbi:MAG: phosphonate C-P lyase system protein PhnH [Oscillospiraceae bacterium]|jgi:alpha-D-ribose 1-methylphosphonate 5-triphosphate synthase subunit PhnH|nr:phosphonate C-P lyase system protein PhnH [Oscillospiraceae bacterium]
MDYEKAIIAQETFKAVMNAFARPFRETRLPERALGGEESSAVKLLAFTLADNAVSLYVHNDGELDAGIRETTNAKPAGADKADFVILRGADGRGMLSKVNRGSLPDPQKGATVIICVPELRGAARITAEGPGIAGSIVFGASECVAEYLREASALDAEYPMGFEMLFVTPRGEILAAPRRVRREAL